MFNEYPYRNLEDLNLDYVLKKVKEVVLKVDDLEEWKTEHEAEYEELKQLYDDLVSGNFPPEVYNSLHNWVVNNSASIMESLVKMVFFGLTKDGHFIAYVPDSWNEIAFNTSGHDIIINDVTFGHLVLSY